MAAFGPKRSFVAISFPSLRRGFDSLHPLQAPSTKTPGFWLFFGSGSAFPLPTLSKYEVPPHIEALDAKLTNGLTDEQIADLEFQFRVVYTLEPSSKTHAHIQFVKPGSEEGKKIHNVLAQKIAGDEFFPHKPTAVAKLVAKRSKKPFSTNDHVKARKHYKIRPPKGSPQPGNTDKRYCLYHPTHKDYTYSDEWVDFLVEEVKDDAKLKAIRAAK